MVPSKNWRQARLCNVRLLIPPRHRLLMQETTNLAKTGIRWKFTGQLEDLDYADDIALISTNHGQMQKKTDKLTEAAQRVGLNSSKLKTRILKINCKNNNSIKFQSSQDIQETNDFTYLGACVSADGGADKDIESRLCKAKTAFRKLRKVWSSKQYSKKTNIKLFHTLVKPVLLYGSETWKTNAKDYEKLDSFEYRCLKRIPAVKEIGRSWVQQVNGDSLGIGLMSAIFQEDGTLCYCSELLNTSVTTGARTWANSLKSQYGSSSGPQAVLLSLERKSVTA
ncbi:putative uncharacterized transposon-derived protein F52C9.6 [Stylophora pistillata]|uniref:Uncharacterized transposon-derived protein F52C9.6 n=1 Tax=Stylophora pistillata TaxID=50429 RepID=A0A2B4SPH2_STYPI|nr:putative uncharacterized transposon-derived protein F52C9.6 [Stylophora pistillata]